LLAFPLTRPSAGPTELGQRIQRTFPFIQLSDAPPGVRICRSCHALLFFPLDHKGTETGVMRLLEAWLSLPGAKSSTPSRVRPVPILSKRRRQHFNRLTTLQSLRRLCKAPLGRKALRKFVQQQMHRQLDLFAADQNNPLRTLDVGSLNLVDMEACEDMGQVVNAGRTGENGGVTG
jgi:hypothetical protein